MGSHLVIGSDGLIGCELLRQLRERGAAVLGTTRRPGAPPERVCFALEYPPARLLEDASVRTLRSGATWTAFLVAAITGIARCAEDPVASHRVNVDRTVALADALARAGAFIVYPSSSAVLSRASDPPATEYGRQKADAERGLREGVGRATDRAGVAIVRLTKVVAPTGLFGEWMRALRSGGVVEAATDLRLSPISLPFAARGLIEIAEGRRSGVYPLSGERSFSYFELAARIAETLGAGRTQVRPVRIGAAEGAVSGSGIALNMAETERYTSLLPQTVESVLRDLVVGF